MERRMKARLAVTALLVGAACALPALAQAPAAPGPAVQPLRNAQEQAPDALIGVWKADIAASRYSGPKPRNNIRTFSYTQDGKLLVTSLTLNAEGRVATLNWTVQLDGTPGAEFQDRAGSIPTNVVVLKKQDERTLAMIVSNRGTVALTGSFKLSDDGKTLTYDYGGATSHNTIIYHKWDMAS